MTALPEPLTEASEVAAVARRLAAAESFAFDLEFASEGRYVPELSLVQVAWGDPRRPRVAAVDALVADPRPVVELVAAPGVATVLHAGGGDLALLAHQFGVQARGVYDTQVAAAFLGLGDQLGYAALVEELLDETVDKAMQYTRWLDRPLSPQQLRYALDDVRHLARAWRELERRLTARGRLAWVAAESERLAAEAARRDPPEEMYRRLRGRRGLAPGPLGALRALAAWRERQALASNKPPSWILKDRALLGLARRLPRTARELGAADGVGRGVARRHGRELLAAIRAGAADPPPAEPPAPRLPPAARRTAAALFEHLGEICRRAAIARRFVASRAEIDDLVRWWLGNDPALPPELPLLAGWRQEVAGEAALDWLRRQARP